MHQIRNVLLLLSLIVSLTNGAPKPDLPDVLLTVSEEKLKLPPPVGAQDPIPVSATESKLPGPDKPRMLRDISSKVGQLEAAFNWCVRYQYITREDAEKVDASNEAALEKALFEPLKRVEKFFGLPQDGIVDNDLLDEMSSERCGEKDNEKASGSRKKRWSQLGSHIWEDLPVTIKYQNWGNVLSQSDQTKAVEHCARLWGKNSGLTFKMADHHERANIEIVYKFIDGAWNTIGTGQSPTPFGNPPTSLLTLDSGERFKYSKNDPESAVSLIWAICHEMGHTLGLSHSHDRNAIMYPSGVGQDENDLSYDDKIGIQALYGQPNGRDFVGGSKPVDDRRDYRSRHHDRRNDRYNDRYNNRYQQPQHQTYKPQAAAPPPPPPQPHYRRNYDRRRRPNYAPVNHRPNYKPSYVAAHNLPTVRFGK